jgi:hypothetical protein
MSIKPSNIFGNYESAYVTLDTAQVISGSKTFQVLSNPTIYQGATIATGTISGTATNALNIVNAGLTDNTNYPLAFLSSNEAGANVTVSSDTGGNHLLFNPSLNQLSIGGDIQVTGAATFNNDISAAGINVGAGADASLSNVAVGPGLLAIITGGYNTAIGHNTSPSIDTGDNNTCVGSNAGVALTSGGSNTVIGSLAAYNLSSGGSNTSIGFGSGAYCQITSNNTCIGALTNVAHGITNSTALGYQSVADNSNQIQLGTTTTYVNCPGDAVVVGALSLGGAISAAGSTLTIGSINTRGPISPGAGANPTAITQIGGTASVTSSQINVTSSLGIYSQQSTTLGPGTWLITGSVVYQNASSLAWSPGLNWGIWFTNVANGQPTGVYTTSAVVQYGMTTSGLSYAGGVGASFQRINNSLEINLTATSTTIYLNHYVSYTGSTLLSAITTIVTTRIG